MDIEDNVLGMIAHLSPFITGMIIGPVILFALLHEKKGIAYENAKNVLNFQLSMIIYLFASFLLSFILIGIFFMIALILFMTITSIMGAVKAYEGGVYSYPLTIRFIS